MAVSAFLAFFGAIYEYYSHQVYSYYMIYAFAIPLVMGALPYGIIALQDQYRPRGSALHLWNSAIAAFTVGSLFKGVLDIYGTTNKLVAVYPIAGGALALAALFFFFLPVIMKKI